MTTITMKGREFKIGATYAPKPKPGVTSHRRKKLLGKYRDWFGETYVEFENKNGSVETSLDVAWLKWVGDEVTS
jgi:hypothetical protein